MNASGVPLGSSSAGSALVVPMVVSPMSVPVSSGRVSGWSVVVTVRSFAVVPSVGAAGWAAGLG